MEGSLVLHKWLIVVYVKVQKLVYNANQGFMQLIQGHYVKAAQQYRIVQHVMEAARDAQLVMQDTILILLMLDAWVVRYLDSAQIVIVQHV